MKREEDRQFQEKTKKRIEKLEERIENGERMTHN